MAVTSIQSNNKLIQFTKDINREFVRNNMFSPYMGEGLDSIIRVRQELKNGGEQMNIPLVTKLTGAGVGSGVLAGAEERIDNYGMRVWLDWWRHAVVTTKAESQKDSADIFGEAKPLLSDRGKELQRDELIQALMAFPSESSPTNLGTDAGQRVNGLMFNSSFPTFTSTTAFNKYVSDNVDRVVFGNALSNHYSTTAIASATSALSVIVSVKLTSTTISLMKRRAELCSPKIRPYRSEDGYEYYVLFAGSNAFRDARADSVIYNANKDARSRENGGMGKNPIFQDGDLLWDGVIVRKVPEISNFVTNTWTALASASVSGRVEPVFLCGQQAATMAFGQMAKPTFRKEDDYGFINGTGIEMAYGVSKMFKKHAMYIPGTSTLNSSATGNTAGGGLDSLVQWGIVTGFFFAPLDA
jgi:N4-gp56 family major capsid protein